jgi:hypothetical protein
MSTPQIAIKTKLITHTRFIWVLQLTATHSDKAVVQLFIVDGAVSLFSSEDVTEGVTNTGITQRPGVRGMIEASGELRGAAFSKGAKLEGVVVSIVEVVCDKYGRCMTR